MNQQIEIEMNWIPITIAEIKISFPATEWGNVGELFLLEGGEINLNWNPEPFFRDVQVVLQQHVDSKLGKYYVEDMKLGIKCSSSLTASGFEVLGGITVLVGGIYMFIKDYPTLKNSFKMINDDIKTTLLPTLNDLMKKEITNRIKHLKDLLKKEITNRVPILDEEGIFIMNKYYRKHYNLQKILEQYDDNWNNMSDMQRKEAIDRITKVDLAPAADEPKTHNPYYLNPIDIGEEKSNRATSDPKSKTYPHSLLKAPVRRA